LKLLTRDTDYAVRALCYIAKRKTDMISVNDLVMSLKVPRPFIRKILQLLNKKGLLESFKGKGGGFKLLRKPGKIDLLTLIEIFQGRLTFADHTFKKDLCHEVKLCPLKKRLDHIEKYARRELSVITIGMLIKDGR